jgi:hypothetical protein
LGEPLTQKLCGLADVQGMEVLNFNRLFIKLIRFMCN